MIKSIAEAAEKVIKSHLSKFSSYASIIPNNVKIVMLEDIFNTYRSSQEEKLLSYMGITDKCDFEYPVGQGSSCLNYILDNCAPLIYQCDISPVKSNESIWKSILETSPWMFNKIVFTSIIVDLPMISADNFYGVKILKFALDKGALIKSQSILFIDTIHKKDMESLKALDQEFFNNGLDEYVIYKTKVI